MRSLPIWALVGPGLLCLLYGFLIFVALTNVAGFYEAMAMPMPNHGFMHISWTGKTVAIWVMLVAATLLRARPLVLLAMAGVLVQQLGDTIAGLTTGVDVFVTQIGLGLSVISLILLVAEHRHARRDQEGSRSGN